MAVAGLTGNGRFGIAPSRRQASSKIHHQARTGQDEDIAGAGAVAGRMHGRRVMKKLPVVDQHHFSGVQDFIEYGRFPALAGVQMRFRAFDVVPVDRVNTDEIGSVLVDAFRSGIAETFPGAGRPDLVDADFGAGTERAKIPKHQQQRFEHLQIDQLVVKLFELPFDVANQGVVCLALEQITVGKLHYAFFGQFEARQAPVAVMPLDVGVDRKVIEEWFECRRIDGVFRSHAKQKPEFEAGRYEYFLHRLKSPCK